MNFSCSFRVHGYQGTSCGTSEQLNLQSSFGYNILGNARFVSKIGSRRKLITSSSDGFNSNKVSKRERDNYLRSSSGPRYTVCILTTSRGNFITACQGNDSVTFINGNGKDVESTETKNGESLKEETSYSAEKKKDSRDKGEVEADAPTLDELKELLQKALKELEIAQLNSTMFEVKAQRISEAAIALKDKALNAWDDVNSVLIAIEEIVKEEDPTKEAIKRANMALSLAEARHQVALESLEVAKEKSLKDGSSDNESEDENLNLMRDEETLLAAQKDMLECRENLENCEKAMIRLRNRKDELQREVVILNEIAEKAQTDAVKAEEDVANIMLLAEEAVAFELEATKRVNDAEIALKKAEKVLAISIADSSESTMSQSVSSFSDEEKLGDEKATERKSVETVDEDGDATIDAPLSEPIQDSELNFLGQMSEESRLSDDSEIGRAHV